MSWDGGDESRVQALMAENQRLRDEHEWLLSAARRMAHTLDYAHVYLPPKDRQEGQHPRWPHPSWPSVLTREDALAIADEFYAIHPDVVA